jgi:hypothetical protein
MRPVTTEGFEPDSEPPVTPRSHVSTGPAHAAPWPQRRSQAIAGVLAVALIAVVFLVVPHLHRDGSPSASLASPQSTASETATASASATTSSSSSSAHPRPSASGYDTLPVAVARAVLARRTAAVRAGNLTAFVADLDQSDVKFVASQRVVFASLQALPLTETSWQLLDPPMPRPDLESRWRQPVADVVVAVRYRLAGFDDHPVARRQTFTLVRRDGRWGITDDPTSAGERPGGDVLDPWDEGPIVVVERAHVLVVGTPGQRDRLGALADRAEAALNDVAAMWTTGWTRRAVVYVPQGTASRHSYFDSHVLGVDRVEAIELPVEDRLAGWPNSRHPKPAGTRVILNLKTVSLTSKQLPAILRHEFTHVATAPDTVAGSPRWLVEGAAEYTAHRADPYRRPIALTVFRDISKGRGITRLVSGPSFYRTADNYDRAWLLFWYISQHWGQDKIKAMYARMGPEGAVTRAQTDHDLKAVLGVSQRELLAGFNRWARTHVRPA